MRRQRRRNLSRSVQDTFKQMFMEPFLDLQYASMAAKLRQRQHWQKWTASHSIDSWDPEPVHAAVFFRQPRVRSPTANLGARSALRCIESRWLRPWRQAPGGDLFLVIFTPIYFHAATRPPPPAHLPSSQFAPVHFPRIRGDIEFVRRERLWDTVLEAGEASALWRS